LSGHALVVPWHHAFPSLPLHQQPPSRNHKRIHHSQEAADFDAKRNRRHMKMNGPTVAKVDCKTTGINQALICVVL
jgi:hypothetical protein